MHCMLNSSLDGLPLLLSLLQHLSAPHTQVHTLEVSERHTHTCLVCPFVYANTHMRCNLKITRTGNYDGLQVTCVIGILAVLVCVTGLFVGGT